MIDLKSTLSVILKTSTTEVDYTYEMSNFSKDEVTFDLKKEDFIYFGFDKPISTIYVNINTPTLVKSVMTVEYFDPDPQSCLLLDETGGLMGSGFIRYDGQSCVKTTFNSISKYWYRLSVDTDRDDVNLAGINLIFSDDYDLTLENPVINSAEFLGISKNHILKHVAVRNDILQKLRNVGVKTNGENYNQWDLHNIEEVKQASVCGVLSKIYFNLSDNKDDVWMSKSKSYSDIYDTLINSVRTSLDTDNDGASDDDESLIQTQTVYMTR